MSKVLVVATEVQKVVFTEALLNEIANGFWREGRPANHANAWNDVTVTVSTETGSTVGPIGFKSPRLYNLTNPDFWAKRGEQLLAVAQIVDPTVTDVELRKQLIQLSHIIGGRLTTVGGTLTKENRGQAKLAAKRAAAGSGTTTGTHRVIVPVTQVAEGEKEAA